MTVDFGSIKRYDPDRGFGFIDRTFVSSSKEVFFHIKNIKTKYIELAQRLDNGEAFETVSFWYEIVTTEKGESVSNLWTSTEDIPQSYKRELHGFIQKLENVWKDVGSPKPSWLDPVTIELVGISRKCELSAIRDEFMSQLIAEKESSRKEDLAKKESSRKEHEVGRIVVEHKLTPQDADELYRLLTEMRSLNFRYSKELSKHIRDNQLGYEYPSISGIVTMRKSEDEWDFHAGFPPKIYRIICTELGLSDQGTKAKPIKFTSYKEVKASQNNF